MKYSEMDGRLIIFRTELKSFDVILPMFQNDIIMIKYFIKSMTKLFVNKFGITPNYVVIDDKMIMDKVMSIPNT
jgi:hypothetical protein